MVDSADGVVIQDVHENVEEEHKLPQENVIILHQSMEGKNVLAFTDILASATHVAAQVRQITFGIVNGEFFTNLLIFPML